MLQVREVTFGYYDGMRSYLGIGKGVQENGRKSYGKIATALCYDNFGALCEDVAGRSHVARVSFKIKEGMDIPTVLDQFVRRDWVRIPSPCIDGVMTELVACAESGRYLSVKLNVDKLRADYEIDIEPYGGEVLSVAVIIPGSELFRHGWNGSYSFPVRALWVPNDADITPTIHSGSYDVQSPLKRQPAENSPLLRQRLAATERSPLLEQRIKNLSRERKLLSGEQQLSPVVSPGSRKLFWKR